MTWMLVEYGEGKIIPLFSDRAKRVWRVKIGNVGTPIVKREMEQLSPRERVGHDLAPSGNYSISSPIKVHSGGARAGQLPRL